MPRVNNRLRAERPGCEPTFSFHNSINPQFISTALQDDRFKPAHWRTCCRLGAIQADYEYV